MGTIDEDHDLQIYDAQEEQQVHAETETRNDQDLRNYMLTRDRIRREIRPPSKYAHAYIIACTLNIGDSIELNEPANYSEVC